jgi:hypothetical protein
MKKCKKEAKGVKIQPKYFYKKCIIFAGLLKELKISSRIFIEIFLIFGKLKIGGF